MMKENLEEKALLMAEDNFGFLTIESLVVGLGMSIYNAKELLLKLLRDNKIEKVSPFLFRIKEDKEENDLILLKEFEKNVNYFFNHSIELQNKYEDEYVAILNEEVVGHNKDLAKLLGDMRKKYKNSMDVMFIQYIFPKNTYLIL